MRTISRALIAVSVLCLACGDDAEPSDGNPSKDERDASRVVDARGQDATSGFDAADEPADDAAASEPEDASVAKDASTRDAGSDGPAGWKLIWSDEFDGAKGSTPDSSKWVMETGGNGFGNNELEYYTNRADNAAQDGNGKLVITAQAESYMGRNYTSARLKTAGKFKHTYGRFEARLKLPAGQGLWPAFWMLGSNLDTGTAWPDCGEIDVMENIGKEPTLVHGTIHGPGYSGGNGIGKEYELPSKAAFSADYHVFAIEWEQNELRWYVDGTLYQTRKPSDLSGKKWVYDHDFFILLNLAVGGQWPGNPDNTTKFPQTLTADYVRVYARE